MKLNELGNDNNPKKARKRVGRGIASGTGKTCGKGHKGQKSRSGASINGFEGGQMPIYRRLPKRGFNNPFRVVFQTLNLGQLQSFVDSGKIDPKKEVTKELLLELSIVKKSSLPVKILGNGDLKVSLNLTVDAASKSAIDKIEKVGGKITLPKKKEGKAA